MTLSHPLVSTLIVLVIALLFSTSDAQEHRSGFSSLVSSFLEFQDSEGGFRTSRRVHGSSLAATSNALFLSSLYGLRHKVNPAEVTRYLQSLENAEGGYSHKAGESANLEAVRNAIQSYHYLGIPFPSSLNVAAYLRGLIRSDTGLFAPSTSQKGDIRSTALALQAMKLLGEIERGYVQDTFKGLHNYLKKHQQDGVFSFPDLSPLSANYYGLLVASLTNYKVDSKAFVKLIVGLQDSNGGFWGNSAHTIRPSYETTKQAISALHILKSVGSADMSSLKNFLEAAPADMVEGGDAHFTLALTPMINEYFDLQVNYEVLDSAPIGERIVQGTKVKPVLTIHSFNTPHSGFSVSVERVHGGKKENIKLEYITESQQYVTVEFCETANLLGVMSFNFDLRNHVPLIGDIHLTKSDQKQVGYGIVVESSSEDANKRRLSEGDVVSVGSEFKFTVKLHNQTGKNLKSGPFSVHFRVLDSSDAVINSEDLDCSRNSASIIFSYTLTRTSIPAGALSFVFDVENDNEQVHTTHRVVYRLAMPMIAQSPSIKANGAPVSAPLKFGDKLSLSVKPSNFPDMTTVQPLDLTDSNKKTISRKFLVEFSSTGGVLLDQVEGKVDSTGKVYNFEYTIGANLDFVGTSLVTFAYLAANGERHSLLNYDEKSAELFDDNFNLNFTLKAELYIASASQTISSDLFYGNEVSQSFKVVDKISKKAVTKGNSGVANVYLSLKHTNVDKKRTFTNAEVAATQDGEVFSLLWTVSPNAIRGSGNIVLATKDADGKETELFKEGTNKEVAVFPASIGGDIEVKSKTFTSGQLVSYTTETAFVVEFSLSCRDQVLKDALLRVNVTNKGTKQVIAGLPVVSDGSNTYQVSWALPTASAASGQYVLEFFREVDRQKSIENRETRERQKKLGLATSEPSEEEEKAFFTLEVTHRAQSLNKLPVKSEFLVLVVLLAAYLTLAYKKMEYTSSK